MKLSSSGVAQKCEAHKDLIQQAEGKQNLLRQAMRDELEKLSNIKRGEIITLLFDSCELLFCAKSSLEKWRLPVKVLKIYIKNG